MKKVVIAGGTGFLGLNLADHLYSKNFQPVLIARNSPQRKTAFEFIKWDGIHLGDWANALNDAVAVVNLAGKSVDCIKTPDNCDLILRSRVGSVNAIGKALREISNPPTTWVQMSTAHIYGDPRW